MWCRWSAEKTHTAVRLEGRGLLLLLLRVLLRKGALSEFGDRVAVDRSTLLLRGLQAAQAPRQRGRQVWAPNITNFHVPTYSPVRSSSAELPR